VAAALSAEYGIGVRHGCFCAHPLITTLLGMDDEESDAIRAGLRAGVDTAVPGAVRASMGLGTTVEDVDRLLDAVAALASSGLRWTYACSPDGTDSWPDPDPRPRPDLPFTLSGHVPRASAGSAASESSAASGSWAASAGSAGLVPARPSHAAPSQAAPSQAAPSQAAPSQAAPSQAAPSHAAPSQAAPSQAAPSHAVPSQAAPSQAAPSQAVPSPGRRRSLFSTI
jgi:hypothetical protein